MLEDVFQTMNTVAQIKIEGKDKEVALAEVKATIFDHESRFNCFSEESEISKLCSNIHAGKQYAISKDLYELLLAANKIKKETHGLFDVDFDNNESQKDFHLSPPNFVIFDSNRTKLNLGAIAKGYTADKAIDRAKKNDIERLMISMGGQITCFSSDKTWKVGLQNPDKDFGQILGSLEIKNGSISTSAEKYRGKHIKNPIKTGWQSSRKSVSVFDRSGTLADAYSTALFLADENTSKNIIQTLKLDVIIIYNETIMISSNLSDRFRFIDERFKVEKY